MARSAALHVTSSHAFAQPQAVSRNGHCRHAQRPCAHEHGLAACFPQRGGIPSLEASPAPVQEPTEFNRDIVELVESLSLDPQYQQWSEEGFDRQFDAYVMTRSIAAFERTLVSGTSKYDAWLQGDVNA